VSDGRYLVSFVCSGNICRSPMAESVFREHLVKAGLAELVDVNSAGIGGWHIGEPMDERGAETLAAAGYPTEHGAAKVGPEHLRADLVLAMDRGHYRALLDLVDDEDRVRMFRSYDPVADPRDLDVPDPYYGPADGFDALLTMIEAAVPGLVEFVRAEVAG
jgi:protein-tyrosine phosphatase